jgi:hypothetical protein
LDESHDAKTEEKKALKIPLDPALAVASMLALEAEGWKFHQLRREVAETLDRASTNAPTFVATSLEILLERRASRDSNLSFDAGAADPLAHVLLECLAKSRAPRETVARPQFDASITVKHARFTEASDRAVAARLIARSIAPRDAFETAETETETVEIALEPRALVRVAETYGVDAADLREAFATLPTLRLDSDEHCAETRTEREERETFRETFRDVSEHALRAYVERLFAKGAHGPAVHLTTHFTLRCFNSAATLRTLVVNNQFDLAFSLAERSNRDARRELIRICGETNEHAGVPRGVARDAGLFPGRRVPARQAALLREHDRAHGGEGPAAKPRCGTPGTTRSCATRSCSA